MTALCNGGASQARPGIVGTAFNTAANITSFLSTFLPMPLAIAIGAVAAVETFDVALYCATDPPADPGLTAQDMVDFLNPGALDTFLPAQAKIRTWWRHIYWWQVCQCTSVPTPPMPTPSNPGDQSSGGGLPSGGVGHCYETTAGWTTTGISSGSQNLDLTSVWIPKGLTSKVINFPNATPPFSVTAQEIPANVTEINFTTHNRGAHCPSPEAVATADIQWYDVNGNAVGGGQFLHCQDVQIGPLTGNTTLPSTAKYVAINFHQDFDLSLAGHQLSFEVDLWFNCADGGLQTPCCPPDPSLELKINQLYQLVLGLGSSSAPVVPIGWHDGTRHSSLRGSGSFLIAASAIGVRFEVTTPPTGVNVDPGNPDFYWDMGFWSPFVLGSPLRGARLVFLNQSFALPEFTDQVGYTLKHGTVVDAIELLPTNP